MTYSCQRVLATLLRHGIDLAAICGSGMRVGRDDCLLWDVALAGWAVEDEGHADTKKSGANKTKNQGKGKSKSMSKMCMSQSLHKMCLLHAPPVAGVCACVRE